MLKEESFYCNSVAYLTKFDLVMTQTCANLTHTELYFILGMILSAAILIACLVQTSVTELNRGAQINGSSHRDAIDSERVGEKKEVCFAVIKCQPQEGK